MFSVFHANLNWTFSHSVVGPGVSISHSTELKVSVSRFLSAYLVIFIEVVLRPPNSTPILCSVISILSLYFYIFV